MRGIAACRGRADTACREAVEVPQELTRTALDLELQEGAVVADRVGETPCVFLAGLHRAERTIAERLTQRRRLSCGPAEITGKAGGVLSEWCEKNTASRRKPGRQAR